MDGISNLTCFRFWRAVGPFPKCTHAVKTYKSNSRPDCDDDATFLPTLLAQDDHCCGGAAVAAPSVAVAAYGAVALMVIESASAARCQKLKQWYYFGQ